ncbi:MAG TPA: GFA family protein [Rhizomicrobium sp.]|jgi:hypothetical protein|nr:GFA family protein [Rhizomicrobium sp.]
MKKTYRGGCHCGAVRFEAELDLEAGTGRCNCSICVRQRFWGARTTPAEFRLLTDPAAMTDYHFNTGSAHHPFCKTCGVAAFGQGDIPQAGGAYVSVNITCLDDIAPQTLAALPVRFCDGANNNWWNAPDVTSYL